MKTPFILSGVAAILTDAGTRKAIPLVSTGSGL